MYDPGLMAFVIASIELRPDEPETAFHGFIKQEGVPMASIDRVAALPGTNLRRTIDWMGAVQVVGAGVLGIKKAGILPHHTSSSDRP